MNQFILYLILFFFGASLGSFLNVLATRYNPDKFLFSKKVIGGRSHCDYCGAQLRWYELIPVFSYLWQLGKCRHCHHRLSIQYFLSEVLSGLIVVATPIFLEKLSFYHYSLALAVLWTAFFLSLLLVSLIDIRLNMIPDELNIFIAILGLAIAIINAKFFNFLNGSLIGSYAPIFDFHDNIFINRLVALAFCFIFFGGLIIFSKGKVMGAGDLKLSVGLALAFGWPEVMLLTFLAFILGSIVGLFLIINRKATMKNYLPFAPFLALGGFLIYAYGIQMLVWYFQLFNIKFI